MGPGPGTLPGTPPGPSPVLPKTSATSADNSGILTVWVPYDAKVTINGLETHSTGSRREFVSYGLKSGLSYKYIVRAQVLREGKLIEETRTVTLTAGQIEAVAFGFNTSPTEQVAAALSVKPLLENNRCVIIKPTGCPPWAFCSLAVEIPA